MPGKRYQLGAPGLRLPLYMPPPHPESSVSVIIPTRNRADKLARCLESVYKSDYGELEVIVVDDASEKTSVRHLVRNVSESAFH